MSKGNKTRMLIVILIGLAVLALMVFSTLPDSSANGLSSPFSFLFRPLELLFSGIREGSANLIRHGSQNRELKEENQRLKEENLELRLKIKDNEQAALAYAELKQAFGLKDRFDSGRLLAANILERPLSPSFAYYRLDLGRGDGLDGAESKALAVIDEYAQLAGRIHTVDAFSSKLLPLTHEGFSASCRSEKEKDWIFRVRGDLALQEEGLMIADGIQDNCPLQVGDILVSSGRGGVFPDGVRIGEIVEIKERNALGERRAVVRPFINFDDSRVLFVLLPPLEVDAP